MGQHAFDIVGYTFNADNYCPGCIISVLPTGPGKAFDGWGLASGVVMSTEDNLSEIALAFGIDKDDENTFDSGDFPKVIFADSVWNHPETCGKCHGDLVEREENTSFLQCGCRSDGSHYC